MSDELSDVKEQLRMASPAEREMLSCATEWIHAKAVGVWLDSQGVKSHA